jgi:hypothetical protein
VAKKLASQEGLSSMKLVGYGRIMSRLSSNVAYMTYLADESTLV